MDNVSSYPNGNSFTFIERRALYENIGCALDQTGIDNRVGSRRCSGLTYFPSFPTELWCPSTDTRSSRRDVKELSVKKKVKGIVEWKANQQNKDDESGLQTLFTNGQLQCSKYTDLRIVGPFLVQRLDLSLITNLDIWFWFCARQVPQRCLDVDKSVQPYITINKL